MARLDPFFFRWNCLRIVSGLLTAAFLSVPMAEAKIQCNPGVILASVIGPRADKTLGIVEEWKMPPEMEKDLAKFWSESSANLDVKMLYTYEKMLEARVNQMGPMSRVLVKLAGRKILERKGWYQKTLGRLMGSFAGSHYNPITNSVFMSTSKGGKLSDFIVAFHEMQHAVDRNSKIAAVAGQATVMKEYAMLLPTPVSALTRYWMESRAIGAQWEFMQRVPEAERMLLREAIVQEAKLAKLAAESEEEWLKQWLKKREQRQSYDPEELKKIDELKEQLHAMEEQMDIIDKITVKSIEFAGLPKQEFIEKMRDFHGYTIENIMRHHYAFGGVRKMLLYGSAFAAYRIGEGIYKGDEQQIKKSIQSLPLIDLRFYLNVIAGSVLDSEKPSSDQKKESQILKDLEHDLDQERSSDAKSKP